MEFRIKETGEIRILEKTNESGIERTKELVGDHEPLKFNRDTEEYESSQEDYDWWQVYITNLHADEKEIAELAEKLGIEEVKIWDRINPELHCHLEDEHIVIQKILKEIREEYE